MSSKPWPIHCTLVREEQLWLDPQRAEQDEDFCNEWMFMDWPARIGQRFGNWLNARLQKYLLVGEVEQRQWKKELLVDESDQGWLQQLHRRRVTLESSRHTPTRTETI